MRIRMEFSKGPELRFVSHLDLLRCFERAMRRADVPLAFSEGFNPHPKMTFASAVAVGVTSNCEYIDIETAQDMDTASLQEEMNRVLPEGLVIKKTLVVDKSLPPLMSLINRSRYEVTGGLEESVAQELLSETVAKLMQKDELFIERVTKKGTKMRNIRPGIVQLSVNIEGTYLKFNMLLHSGSELNIRPEEVVRAFKEYGGLELNIAYLQIQKTGQYIARGDQLLTPLDSAVLQTAGS